MIKIIDSTWLSKKINNPTLQEITSQIITLINTGEIPAGTILPSVRELAKELGVSPATISSAWQILRQRKMITGQGRQGITVNDQSISSTPLCFFDFSSKQSDKPALDLTYSVSDPTLLPDLNDAINYSINVKDLNDPLRAPITQCLKQAVIASWPYQPDAFMALNSGCEAITVLLKTNLLAGSCIAIEQPCTLNYLEILKQHGANIIQVKCDDEGPIPDSLMKALKKNHPRLFINPAIIGPPVAV